MVREKTTSHFQFTGLGYRIDLSDVRFRLGLHPSNKTATGIAVAVGVAAGVAGSCRALIA
jgi:hypothetical protein